MRSIAFGKTGLRVSEVGFGGIPIIPLSMDDAMAVVGHAVDRGITFFDTANMYADSEKKIGAALKGLRDQVVLATKTLNRDAAGAAQHIAFSLSNLQTDRIDLYQFHNISTRADLNQVLGTGGAMEAVRTAMDAGSIRFCGFSSHDTTTAVEACRTGLFSSVQIPFNFIEHEPAGDLFAAAREQGMGMIGMKPFGGGLLDRADLCIRFLQQYGDVMPIPGFSTVAEIDQVVAMYEHRQQLGSDDFREIDRTRSELGKSFCHRCGYCGPCEQGVKITEVMMFRSMARRIEPSIAVFVAKAAMETVDDCTECGECMEKCPYRLAIPELLQDALGYYRELSGRGV